MSSSGYASFLKAMGHNVCHHAGVYWFDAHPGIYMSFPFQTLVSPEDVVVKDILNSKGIALRYPCGVQQGRPSYRIVVNETDYDLSSLTSKARNQTRRGLEWCQVQAVSFDQLGNEAIRLNEETLLRQGRTLSKDFKDYWNKYFIQAAQAEGAEAWGAFVNSQLAAYLIAFRIEGVAHILIVRSARGMLSKYPNNALLFSYVQSVLKEDSINEVSIGLESIQGGMASLDKFKAGMGFKKLPIGQRIEFSPWIKPFLRPSIRKIVLGLADKFANDNEKLAKFSGMIRWYDEQESTHV